MLLVRSRRSGACCAVGLLIACGLPVSAALATPPATGAGAPAAGIPLGPVFSDHTVESGCTTLHTPSAWMIASNFNASNMLGGGAVGDFNNDGFQDIFVVNSGGIRDCLFINNGDGAFTDMTVEAGLDELHMGIGAAVGDYDNDGDLDIFVTSVGAAVAPPVPGAHRLYRNNGDLTFTNVAEEAGVNYTAELPDGFGATFGDVDLDGDLDLYVAAWRGGTEGNRLFQNNGDGTFTDITVEAGLDVRDLRGFAPSIIDMNGDRYPEIFVTGDFDTSHYWINNRDGTFTEVARQAGLAIDDNGMGSGVADFNGDGLLDWYVSSIWTTVGLPPGVPGTGNMMYINQGDHSYVEVAGDNGTRDGGWGWGVSTVDFDHDGLVDIATTNGWHEGTQKGFEWNREQTYLFHQQPDGSFIDVAVQAGVEHYMWGRALSHLDIDNDGDLDFFIASALDEFRVYRNEIQNSQGDHNYLRVFLNTSGNDQIAPNGVGSRVIAVVDGVEQLRFIDSGSSYLSTKELSAHFGVGAAESIDELRIEWTNGQMTSLENVDANQTITIDAPTPCVRDWNTDQHINAADVGAFLNDYFLDLNDGGDRADVTGDGATDGADVAEFLDQYFGACR